jgi:hypothetical protein
MQVRSLVLTLALTACFGPIGHRNQLLQHIEGRERLDPATCEDMGSSVVCGDVSINITKDDAASCEATVVHCHGETCSVAYMLRCDLAGCLDVIVSAH